MDLPVNRSPVPAARPKILPKVQSGRVSGEPCPPGGSPTAPSLGTESDRCSRPPWAGSGEQAPTRMAYGTATVARDRDRPRSRASTSGRRVIGRVLGSPARGGRAPDPVLIWVVGGRAPAPGNRHACESLRPAAGAGPSHSIVTGRELRAPVAMESTFSPCMADSGTRGLEVGLRQWRINGNRALSSGQKHLRCPLHARLPLQLTTTRNTNIWTCDRD